MGFLDGLTSGWAQGNQAFIQGQDDRSKRDFLEQERQNRLSMMKIEQEKAPLTLESLKTELEGSKLQLQEATRKINQDRSYNYISAFQNSQNPSDYSSLNMMLKDVPSSKEALGALYNPSSMSPIVNIQPITADDRRILPPEVANGSVDINPRRMMKGITADGNEVFMDLSQFVYMNGYAKRLTKDKFDELSQQFDLRTKAATATQEEFKAANPMAGMNKPTDLQKNALFFAQFDPDVKAGRKKPEEAVNEYIQAKTFDASTVQSKKGLDLLNALNGYMEKGGNVPEKEVTSLLGEARTYKMFEPKDINKDALLSKINVTKEARNLWTKVDGMKNEELSRGAVDQGIKALNSYFSDDAFQKASPQEKTKILTSIKFESELGNLVAQYIKSISGTAVAEAEYNRLTSLFGADKLKNTQTMKAALSGWIESMTNEVNLNVENAKANNPFDYVYYKNELNKGRKSLDSIFGGK